ncbi:MAG: purine-nucleoside phosphorylase [Candidatus Brocadiia bacterium]
MIHCKQKIIGVVKYITSRKGAKKIFKSDAPQIGIILGTGLGAIASTIQKQLVIPYKNIPGFLVPTVASHKGNLVIGKLSGKTVLAMEGRFHHYEGYSMQNITFPVRVMKALGVKILIIGSAVGSVNPTYPEGTIVLVKDHINLMGNNPLIGHNDDSLGPRFPDMGQAYDANLLKMAEHVARANKIKSHRGIYAAMTGPNLETPAEYNFIRVIGADVVGMSTVPEVIVGIHAGLRILALAVVTDLARPGIIKKVSLAEIIHIANEAEPKMAAIVKGVIKLL